MSSRIAKLGLWAALFSLLSVFTSAATAAAESVELHSAFFGIQSKYGCTQKSGTFSILTSSFGYQKNVFVHLQERDGTWSDLAALYVETLPDGRELWRTSVTYGEGACPTARTAPSVFRFAIKVAPASGGEQWDNNGGADYSAEAASGDYLPRVNVLAAGGSVFDGKLYVNAAVKNLGYSKQVDVVYSTDGWQTTYYAPLAFVSTYMLGYGTFVSPNSSGVERFQGTTQPAGSGCFDYALRYRVNGQTYWDNNFGRDYRACPQQ